MKIPISIIVTSLAILVQCSKVNTTHEPPSKLKTATQLVEIQKPTVKLAKIKYKKGLIPKEIFEVKSENLDFIESKNGNVYYFPSNCFVDSDLLPISGKVVIEINELTNPDELVKSGITTQTVDNKLLSSAGSFCVKARQNGKVLSLDKRKPIRAFFKTKKKDLEMQLFSSISSPENEDLLWKSPKNINLQAFKIDTSVLNSQKRVARMSRKIWDLNWDVNNFKRNSFFINSLFYNTDDKKRYVYQKGNQLIYYTTDFQGSNSIDYLVLLDSKLKAFNMSYTVKTIGLLKDSLESIISNRDRILAKLSNKEEVQYYQLSLNELSWYNIDKYASDANLVAYTGTLPDKYLKGNECEISLVSYPRFIHLKTISKNGKFTFNYLPKESFKLIIRNQQMVYSQMVDGNSSTIEML